MGPIEVVLFTRPGCCLCHDAHEVLERVRQRHPFVLIETNIDSSEELSTLYGAEIPVVTINGRKAFKFTVDPVRLERLLKRAG